MSAASSSSRIVSLRRIRSRAIGAAAAVVVFLGTTAMAPFSTTSAFADAGSAAPGRQGFTSASAAAPVIDLGVSSVDAKNEGNAGEASGAGAGTGAEYTLQEFMFSGVVNWGGYKFTFYSQQVLPGPGLQIPGRHLNADGYVSDGDGYIVLAGSAPKGTVYETPFGHPGKIYDRGTVGNHLDVYIR